MIQEHRARAYPGFMTLAAFIVVLLACLGVLYIGTYTMQSVPLVVIAVLVGAVTLFCMGGFFVVSPNEAAIGIVFGSYAGSVKTPGYWWMNPFALKRRTSLKIRNFESGHLKVNDKDGNPIEIAAIVVWRVVETAEALFNVDSYENFLQVQCEAAIRNLATLYSYDSHQEGDLSLRGNTNEVADKLKNELHERLGKAGIEIIEARISHLAYAPEIASTMLRRQQANAIIAARARIVEGAVSMVEMALDKLEEGGKVHLDEERKASMVSNLLVVLTSDRDAQPVVNTGTIYQ
ncbi:MAG: SPFH domain-containing protein [Candidatus Kerfeldbacteria bacterium]|nr:SPFH domain-containing protein [Candidatus Kerfeldbacteria bacterium]